MATTAGELGAHGETAVIRNTGEVEGDNRGITPPTYCGINVDSPGKEETSPTKGTIGPSQAHGGSDSPDIAHASDRPGTPLID